MSGEVCVCKLVTDGSFEHLKKKRLAEDDTRAVKKLRKDETLEQVEDSSECSVHCETHLKEIERLKKEARQREKEISSLNKIIAALARKQGL